MGSLRFLAYSAIEDKGTLWLAARLDNLGKARGRSWMGCLHWRGSVLHPRCLLIPRPPGGYLIGRNARIDITRPETLSLSRFDVGKTCSSVTFLILTAVLGRKWRLRPESQSGTWIPRGLVTIAKFCKCNLKLVAH